MAEENIEPQVEEETPVEEETTEEETDLDFAPETEPEPEEVTISKSDLNRLKRKAIAYDAGKTAKPKPQEDTSQGDERFERLELRADGYSKDEIEEIMALGGTKVLKTKIVQSAIKSMRAEAKSKDEKEPLNSKSPVYKKFSQDDISKMSSTEMEKILRE